MKLKLFKYQKTGVLFLAKRRRSLLADVPGLGKTPQAVVATELQQAQHIVVVCPASVQSTWQAEFTTWKNKRKLKFILPRKKFTKTKKAEQLKHFKLSSKRTNVIIISYDLLTRQNKWQKYCEQALNSDANSSLILDEAHYIKSWLSKRTKIIMRQLIPAARNTMLLTGTPQTNSVMDLHPLYSICEPGKWGTYFDFGGKYSTRMPDSYAPCGYVFRGVKNTSELKKRSKKFMLRRYKSEVQKDLPEKIYSSVIIELSEKDNKHFEAAEILKVAVQNTQRLQQGLPVKKPKELLSAQKDLGIAKVKPITAWFDEYFINQPDESIVVFAWHKQVVQQLAEYFIKKDKSTCVLSGDTQSNHRKNIIDGFQSGKYQVMVGNLKAAGIGITLHRACECFFAELYWDATMIAQAADRLHRIGATKTVLARFFVTNNQFEQQLVSTIRTKIIDAEKTIGLEDGSPEIKTKTKSSKSTKSKKGTRGKKGSNKVRKTKQHSEARKILSAI